MLGYSDNTSISLSREIAVMVGSAWRCHDHAILTNDPASQQTAKTFCKTLEVVPHGDQAVGLRALLVESERMVVAVHHVKQRLLVAAMLSKEEFRKEKAASATSSSDEGNASQPPSKKQVLLWRAQGMAEELQRDLANFQLPKDFY